MQAPHRFAIRVYYEDTDFSGVVYHASYLRFLERGRTEFLRALGIGHRSIFAGADGESLHFVVRAMSIEFIKPALMDDSLWVETSIETLGGASVEMSQAILRDAEPPLIKAKVRIGMASQGKARRIPPLILNKLKGEASPP
ncbi:YbgC/FadM family acyl-CoA thioesterase [Methylocapsa palsarum]|uniref:YbgC/FadM family acyl-CoA thioesterase n=1 Tax=Methylocapsa palsarum TaxID=1612308 RepID=UPI000B85AF85|nr:YbgC/FadM family acyl-CoA thioesterase [Methylocapsa palsarum]